MGRHMVKFDAPDYAGCDTQCTRYFIRGAVALRAYLICGVIAACDTCLKLCICSALDLVIVKLEPSDTVPGTWVHPTGVHEGAEGLSSLHELVAQAQAAADAPLYSNQAAGRQASQGRPGLPTDNKWLEGQKLPQFSDEVQPLLHGGELTREEHHRLAKQFRREIIDFLNSRNLISDTSSGGRRWKYHYLGLTLASQFPKLQWDFRGHRASHGDHTKAKSRFLSKLAEARRHQHARAKSREVTVPLEPSS
ncbi:uncharacterized protein LOC119390400 [Rhipicephalus sanguineus]|uniref:uncharacterized protein LOC119390400 n=1 Tax=Rhipicephalus sanguineus TaxID=34632 RepID=UPI0020C55A87|nr:uncharacterized protein LOC119390400 [Rhipicephalus sanguineus]